MEDDIYKLQEIVTNQGEDIQKLSHELYTQQKEIAALREVVKNLKNKMDAHKENIIRPIQEEEPPPHY